MDEYSTIDLYRVDQYVVVPRAEVALAVVAFMRTQRSDRPYLGRLRDLVKDLQPHLNDRYRPNVVGLGVCLSHEEVSDYLAAHDIAVEVRPTRNGRVYKITREEAASGGTETASLAR